MGAFVFDKCCFCIELKTGCFIIGYLSLVGYAILGVFGLLGIIGGTVVTQHPDLLKDKDFSDSDTPLGPHGAQDLGVAVIVVSAILLLVVAFMLTFVIVLLVGLHKNKPGHVKAYLIFCCIFIIFSILGLIGSVFSVKQEGGASALAQSIIKLLWSIYTTLVIRSQYFVMRSPERGPAIYSAA